MEKIRFQKNSDEMMCVISEQKKSLYLKAYVGSVYKDGVWRKMPEGQDPLQWFLTTSRTGNQMLYASAAVEAFRAHGIPAMKWEEDFLAYLKKLEEKKPVIFCGDLNVAVEEIDLKNPKTNRKNAGFTDEEREKMRTILSNGFIDTFRYLYPDQTGIYSWWSYRFNARKNNAGWRIDYFIVSECLKDRISDAKILTDVMGSDHCPIELDFK